MLHDDFVISKKYLDDSLKYDSEKVIKELGIPTFLIYGERDHVVPPSEGIKFKKFAKNADVRLEIIAELDHDFSGESTKKKVLEITHRWLKETIM